jgi:serine/threonine protein kinase
MLFLLKHVFIVHNEAVVLAGVLHRDISGGNLLIDRKGHGMLTDWDLCAYMSQLDARRLARTVRISFKDPTTALLYLSRARGSLCPFHS